MKIHPDYHSGLAPELDAEPLDRFACGPVLAFKHDIRDGWPKEFSLCDVIYSEPPWRVGYNEFLRRAGATGEYDLFVAAFAAALETTVLPTFVTLGDSVVARMPKAVTMRKIKLHGLPAWLAQYGTPTGIPDWGKTPTNFDVMDWLATNFGRVGDCCCGYGMTGRHFVAAGKRCVLSDFNPKCIGYIAKHWTEWQ